MNCSYSPLNLLFTLCVFFAGAKGNTFYSLNAVDIKNEKVNFEEYKGKVVVIVNVASECGFTDGHYRELTRLDDLMKSSGKLVILGFPCNQFGAQEPGDNEQILQFVQDQYNVKFPMFSKIDVFGESQHSVYRFLQDKTNQVPNWNFWKYLMNHEGEVLGAWSPRQDVNEMMSDVVNAIKAATIADGSEPRPPPSASKPGTGEIPRHDDL